MRVWEVATGKEVSRLIGHRGAVDKILWTPDGRLVTRSREDRRPLASVMELKVWEPLSGREIISLRGLVANLEFLPSLNVFFQGGVLWDVSPLRKEKPQP